MVKDEQIFNKNVWRGIKRSLVCKYPELRRNKDNMKSYGDRVGLDLHHYTFCITHYHIQVAPIVNLGLSGSGCLRQQYTANWNICIHGAIKGKGVLLGETNLIMKSHHHHYPHHDHNQHLPTAKHDTKHTKLYHPPYLYLQNYTVDKT